MSIFVLDASYALTWCFPDRATAAADETLRRLEAGADTALVPWIWQLESATLSAKRFARGKATLPRVIELWERADAFANPPRSTGGTRWRAIGLLGSVVLLVACCLQHILFMA